MAHDMFPSWANEAVNDLQAIHRPIDPARPHLRVTIGYSDGYGDLLTVVYLDIDGEHIGVTAYPAGRQT